MSRTDHSRPPYWRMCWWCDGHHRKGLRCPDGSARLQARELDKDMRQALQEWSWQPRRLSHRYEALDLDGFDEHPDCDYCGTLVPEFDVPGVTLQRSTEAKLCVDVLPRGVVSVSG